MPELLLPRLSAPSLRTGYARNAAESANPGLWKGMVGAWVPALDSGIALRNQVNGVKATPGTALVAGNFIRFKGIQCIDYQETVENTLLVPNVWGINAALEDTTAFQRVSYNNCADYEQSFGNDSNVGWISARSASPQIYGYINGNVLSPGDAVNGSWQNACMTIDASQATSQCQLWLDGHAGSLTQRNPVNGTSGFRIGSHSTNGGWCMDGKIAETYLWRRVLTPSEIRQLSSDPLAPFRLRPIVLSIPGEAPPPPTTRRRILISMS